METNHTIAVTGATGQIGSKIASFLVKTPNRVRLIGRDLEKLNLYPEAQKVQADYTDVPSLDRAFAGVERTFIVSGSAEPHKRALLHKNAFDAAQRAGVSYIVYLSFLAASPTSKFPMARDHFESQEYLAATEVPYTALQDSFYSEMAEEMFDKEGVMKGPAGSGKVSWVGRDEVAEAVSNLLLSDRPHLGTLQMTGSKAYSMDETAEVLSQITGRALRYQEESVAEAKAWRAKLASEAWVTDVWVGSYEAIAAGEVADVSQDLTKLLGRPAANLETYITHRLKKGLSLGPA